MHFKDLLGSIARVGFCIPVADFYLELHRLRCWKYHSSGLINQWFWRNLISSCMNFAVYLNQVDMKCPKERPHWLSPARCTGTPSTSLIRRSLTLTASTRRTQPADIHLHMCPSQQAWGIALVGVWDVVLVLVIKTCSRIVEISLKSHDWLYTSGFYGCVPSGINIDQSDRLY